MKQYFTILFVFSAFIIAGQCAFSQTFVLTTPKDTVTITAGDTAKIDINVTIYNNFDATIFLKFYKPYIDVIASAPRITSETLNYPYKGLQLIVPTKAYITKPGSFLFSINGSNGAFQYQVNIVLKIKATVPPQNWRIFPLWKSSNDSYGNAFVMQDERNNYWNNFNGLHQLYTSEPSESWGTTSSNFDAVTNPPVVDYKNNKLWLPTFNGLVRCNFNGSSKTLFDTTISPLDKNPITALVQDKSTGDIWVGNRKGLYRFSGSIWTKYDSSNSVINADWITSIVVSGKNVWIGTLLGIVKFDGTNWYRYKKERDTGIYWAVRVMAVDSTGDVWVGLGSEEHTLSTGELLEVVRIAKFNGDTWTVFDSKDTPEGLRNTNFIAVDSKNNKWMSSANHTGGSHNLASGGIGIVKYDNKEWTVYSSANSPLPGNTINWVGVDKFDNIWFHDIPNFITDKDGFWGVFNENGKPLTFTVTGVDEQPAAISDDISIYPNPISTSFIVSGVEGVASLSVVNSLGAEVMSNQVVREKQVVDITSLPGGLYFVKVRSSSGIVVKPVVVSR